MKFICGLGYFAELILACIGGVFAVLLVVVCLAVPSVFVMSSLQANSMSKLGYEAKVVNFECFAKHKDRWLSCGAVMSNQVEVIQK